MTPVGVGFVGAGSVLWAYLQQLDRLVPRGLACEGPISARRSEGWPALLRRRPGARLVSEARAVVESLEVDVVVVITPPDSHAELARLALEHGKHVLVEKPLALFEAAFGFRPDRHVSGLLLGGQAYDVDTLLSEYAGFHEDDLDLRWPDEMSI